MAAKFLFVLVVLTFSLVATQAQSNCNGPNQFHSDCAPNCPSSTAFCESIRQPGVFCITACAPGCACEEGYKKNSNGQCVLPQFC